MARVTRKNRYSLSGATAVLDVLSPVQSLQELAARMELANIAALVFIHESGKIQYLYAPAVVYDDDGNPTRILGNACDSQDDFRPIEIGPEAFTYTVNKHQEKKPGWYENLAGPGY